MFFKPKDLKIPEIVNMPISLYKSLQGKYFVGYADNLTFNKGTSAWASLSNPPNSTVNLHVNVWTVTSLFGTFRAQIWFNANLPGTPEISQLVTTSNTTIIPNPKPKIKLLLASNVKGEPSCGIKAFVRRGEEQSTIVAEEDGKFIFPPGGSFSVYISEPETPEEIGAGRIAFGWWEEPICK
ncbi:DUF6143 family protein [Phosphitispora sp. TUW77]|uniref:DUF6143 family protein n=1 Tax=Phosphitispora sp. TUW77 TaxID=3152361 RepID=UPI003AB38FBF